MVQVFERTPPNTIINNPTFLAEGSRWVSDIDTVLGLEIFPVIHDKTKETIYISLEDIKDA